MRFIFIRQGVFNLVNACIRPAEKNDLNGIMQIYSTAREFMAKNGNPNQWGKVFPPKELIADDIENGRLFVIEENGSVHGVFAFIIGVDPTYAVIESGSWLSDTEYGAIHRVASDGKIHGVLSAAVGFCLTKISHLRIDTHKDNKVMQRQILKNRFTERGTIYTDDGSPRIAYERL